MANFTLIELHIEEGTFSTSLPFSNLFADDEGEEEELDDGEETETAGSAESDSGGPGKGTAAIGMLVFLIVAAAVVRYLSGDNDETEVDIHTTEDDGPVGVTVDTDSE